MYKLNQNDSQIKFWKDDFYIQDLNKLAFQENDYFRRFNVIAKK